MREETYDAINRVSAMNCNEITHNFIRCEITYKSDSIQYCRTKQNKIEPDSEENENTVQF